QLLLRARDRFGARDTVEAGVVDQDVERLLEHVEVDFLRHQAEQAHGPVALGVQVDVEHADLARGLVDQGRDDADQGRLAGAVGAEQGVEVPRRDLQRNALERFHAVSVDLAEVTYRQRGGRGGLVHRNSLPRGIAAGGAIIGGPWAAARQWSVPTCPHCFPSSSNRGACWRPAWPTSRSPAPTACRWTTSPGSSSKCTSNTPMAPRPGAATPWPPSTTTPWARARRWRSRSATCPAAPRPRCSRTWRSVA